MLGLTIILVLFAALLYSGRVARPAWAQTSTMTLAEFAAKRQTLRTLTNTIRERKCRPAVHGFRTPAWQVAHRAWNLAYWRGHYRHAKAAKSACGQIRHRSLWLCIHSREGAWNDPNPPYFGGLQMGYWFMGTYGDRGTYGRSIYAQEGTANNWSPEEQMGVAEAAYREEGYSTGWLRGQWPNTHQGCGL